MSTTEAGSQECTYLHFLNRTEYRQQIMDPCDFPFEPSGRFSAPLVFWKLHQLGKPRRNLLQVYTLLIL